MVGLVNGCGENFGTPTNTIQSAHQTPRKEPTSTAKLRIDLVHLSSDLKYSTALPSSPLRLRAACVPHALHPTDEFDAPSVRKDTQPENTRVQPPQGLMLKSRCDEGRVVLMLLLMHVKVWGRKRETHWEGGRDTGHF